MFVDPLRTYNLCFEKNPTKDPLKSSKSAAELRPYFRFLKQKKNASTTSPKNGLFQNSKTSKGVRISKSVLNKSCRSHQELPYGLLKF